MTNNTYEILHDAYETYCAGIEMFNDDFNADEEMMSFDEWVDTQDVDAIIAQYNVQ